MLSINTIARVAVNVVRSASQPTSFDTGALLVKDSSYAAGGFDGLPAGGGKGNAPRKKGCGRVRAGGGDPAGVRGNVVESGQAGIQLTSGCRFLSAQSVRYRLINVW